MAPIAAALKMANVTLQELHTVEMIVGNACSQGARGTACLGGIELGMHLSSDESMALVAAFHGANVSMSVKVRVRHVGMADVKPFVVREDFVDSEKKGEANDGEKKKTGLFVMGKKREGEEDNDYSKHAAVFKVGSKLGAKKKIAFLMDRDFHVQVNYEESDSFQKGLGCLLNNMISKKLPNLQKR